MKQTVWCDVESPFIYSLYNKQISKQLYSKIRSDIKCLLKVIVARNSTWPKKWLARWLNPDIFTKPWAWSVRDVVYIYTSISIMMVYSRQWMPSRQNSHATRLMEDTVIQIQQTNMFWAINDTFKNSVWPSLRLVWRLWVMIITTTEWQKTECVTLTDIFLLTALDNTWIL